MSVCKDKKRLNLQPLNTLASNASQAELSNQRKDMRCSAVQALIPDLVSFQMGTGKLEAAGSGNRNRFEIGTESNRVGACLLD